MIFGNTFTSGTDAIVGAAIHFLSFVKYTCIGVVTISGGQIDSYCLLATVPMQL